MPPEDIIKIQMPPKGPISGHKHEHEREQQHEHEHEREHEHEEEQLLKAFTRCIAAGNSIEVEFSLSGTITCDNDGLFSPPFVPGSYTANTTIGPYATAALGTANFTFDYVKNGVSMQDTLKLEIKTTCP